MTETPPLHLSVMGLVSKLGLKSEIFPNMNRETTMGLFTLTISRIEGGRSLKIYLYDNIGDQGQNWVNLGSEFCIFAIYISLVQV